MHRTRYNTFTSEFLISPRSPILVKSGGISPNPSLPDMSFVRTAIVGGEEVVYIPGSSLKGILRSYIEKILRTKVDGLPAGACDPFDKNNSCSRRLEDIEETNRIYKDSCRACKIFGNSRLRARLSVLDAYPINEIKTEKRHGVAISRLTQAAVPGALYETEVAVSGSFKSTIRLENFESWQIGLLALAVRGFNDGFLKLGFGKNRGFGEVNIKIESIDFTFSKTPPKNEIWGLGVLSSPEEITHYDLSNTDKFPFTVDPASELDEVVFTRRCYSKAEWEKLSQAAIAHLKEVLS